MRHVSLTTEENWEEIDSSPFLSLEYYICLHSSHAFCTCILGNVVTGCGYSSEFLRTQTIHRACEVNETKITIYINIYMRSKKSRKALSTFPAFVERDKCLVGHPGLLNGLLFRTLSERKQNELNLQLLGGSIPAWCIVLLRKARQDSIHETAPS